MKRRRYRSRIAVHRALEERRLLAGVHFNSATGELTVIGDGDNNVGQVAIVDGEVEATISGAGSFRFDPALVTRVSFVGFGGDDEFSNLTSIEGHLFGHAGNDILRGGSEFDVVNGGTGNDTLFGGGGDDRIIGSTGDDLIYGDDGNDRILTGPGLNEVYGGDGNDTIFGGNDADTIYGGAGADQIYALAGDDILFSNSGGTPGGSSIEEMDLILGLAGNDTITGESGLDVFWGGAGNDTLIGGSGENRLHGQAGEDVITGGDQADFLTGGSDYDQINAGGGNDYVLGGEGGDLISGGTGDDTIRGQAGDDFIYGNEGKDFLEGGVGFDQLFGTGEDVASFYLAKSNYTVSGIASYTTVEDNVGIEDVDELNDMGFMRFSDGLWETGTSGQEVVTIQPIVVSNDDGSNTAEYFGNASQQAEIHARVDQIFSQANIRVVWLEPNYWNNTFANVGNQSDRPDSDLDSIVSMGDNAGVGNADPLVLDMYFVEVVPFYNDTGENYTNGLAYVGFNGITMHVGDNMLSNQGKRNVVGNVAAHEIAHNLGLDHVDDPNNLMDGGDRFYQWQIDTMILSGYSVPE